MNSTITVPVLVILALAACGDAQQEAGAPVGPAPATAQASIPATLDVPGNLANKDIVEASGLAASGRRDDLLWTHNDSGAKARLYAIGLAGEDIGRLKVKQADNVDWEDIASFSLAGTPYLLVADVGDNERKRETVTLYVIEEPDLSEDAKQDVTPAWTVTLRYPDGPRDVEAVAVDIEDERVLLLTKRAIPAELYSVPLQPGSNEIQIAELLGKIDTLPQPTQQDIRFALRMDDWRWQPTAMDIAPDGSALAILTYYPAVYLYLRDGDWLNSLQQPPLRLTLRNLRDPESVAFAANSQSLFVTNEERRAALLRIDVDIAAAASPHVTKPDVTIMTFNVQNLFDNIDDEGKDDKAYLPLAAKRSDAHIAECNTIPVASWRAECLELDWSDAAIDFKLQRLATTVMQIDGGQFGDGRGPDIIAFQEVENAAILERLSREYLAESGYGPAVLIEGQDLRGIDTAFLSRLPLARPATLHPLRFPEHPEREKDTRGVLQADFRLPDGSILTGFAVHFPAPFHPAEMRIAAYQHLNELRAALPDDHFVFAAGDFNTTSGEDAQEGMLERFVHPHWTAVHEIACDECKGTHYYARDDVWSYLDMILWSPAKDDDSSWRVEPSSIRVANRFAAQVTKDGTPARFRLAEKTGVSDHWPLVMSISNNPTDR